MAFLALLPRESKENTMTRTSLRRFCCVTEVEEIAEPEAEEEKEVAVKGNLCQ